MLDIIWPRLFKLKYNLNTLRAPLMLIDACVEHSRASNVEATLSDS